MLQGRLPSAACDRRIAPDLVGVEPVRPHLELWAAFGEQVVLAALPHPGHVGGLAGQPAELIEAALEAGECVYVPALGGALVPTEVGRAELSQVTGTCDAGADGERATTQWRRFDSAPVESWRLDALSVSQTAGQLTEHTDQAVNLLASAHQPWSSRGLRMLADAALASEELALPPGIPPATHALILRAAATAEAAQLGLDVPDDGSAAQVELRTQALRSLLVAADTALAAATAIAALQLAGLRADRRDDW